MEDGIATDHRIRQRFNIEIVTAQHTETRMFQRVLQKQFLTGREIVPTRDGKTVRQKPVDQIRSNKTSGPGDENLLH